MYPVSDTFKTAVRSSHVVAQRVEILDGGEVAATLDTLVDGTVTEERADVRRRGDLQLVDVDGTLAPDDARDLLTPFGNEIRPWRGITYPDGTSELVPLATLVISQVEIEWPQIRVVGYDRGWLAAKSRFVAPKQFKNKESWEAIETLLTDHLPAYVTFNLPTTAETITNALFETESDPWAAATSIADSLGMQLYCDRFGVVTLADEPDLVDDQPVATFAEGDDGVLLGLTRGLDAEEAFNGVIATGESTSSAAPYRAEVWDEDPVSPTYRYSKFGERPRFHSSPLLTSQTKAAAAAKTMLKREIGIADQVRFPFVVDPSLDVGDVIHVQRATSKVDSLHILDSLSIPLRAGQAMDATTRARQVLDL